MAPEIVKRVEFDYELADAWALGIVLYALLTGSFPFKGVTNKDLYQKISKGAFSMPRKASMDAKRVLLKTLEVDLTKRKRLFELSQDDWINDKDEMEKLKELKRRNYQLKRVYTNTKPKIVRKTSPIASK
jgi:serine/threonine protein kinase